MDIRKEWNYNYDNESIESLSSYIISNARSSLKILEAMEDDMDNSWLAALKLMVQGILSYSSIIQRLELENRKNNTTE